MSLSATPLELLDKQVHYMLAGLDGRQPQVEEAGEAVRRGFGLENSIQGRLARCLYSALLCSSAKASHRQLLVDIAARRWKRSSERATF
jgi:hypothetical protein